MTDTLCAVTLVSGESRVIERTWDDAYECPWCWYPVTGGTCGNPACDTQLSAEGLAERRAEQERRAEAEAAERRLRAWRHESAARAAAERDALWAEVSGRAAAAGQCITCLRRSYWQSRPKFVRHREPGNCPDARR